MEKTHPDKRKAPKNGWFLGFELERLGMLHGDNRQRANASAKSTSTPMEEKADIQMI